MREHLNYRHLSPDSVWFTERRVASRPLSVFPQTTVWGGGSLLVGMTEPLRLSRADFEIKLRDPARAQGTRDLGTETFDQLLGAFDAGPAELAAFVGPGPILTDDRPSVEYFLSLPRVATSTRRRSKATSADSSSTRRGLHWSIVSVVGRTNAFCERFGISAPILLAPMAGASAPALSIAVANAGGLGACGAVLMRPGEIVNWAATVRASTAGPFQINLWIPDPPPLRDAEREMKLRTFLSQWGPPVPPDAAETVPPDFEAQCEALIEARPPIVSSVMGIYPAAFVARLKSLDIAWFAVASTAKEARIAEAAGADVIVAQGMEAGGHRGAFDAATAERQLVGLFSLVPAIVDAVRVPVVATGGIGDGRGVAAALALGASAVQIGTGFLRCPEAQIHSAWAEAIGRAAPEHTVLSRVFSGRAGRSLDTAYVRAATAADAPRPAAYPVQRGLTAPMRSAAAKSGDIDRMQAWAGQSAALARAEPAAQLLPRLWAEAQSIVR